MPVATTRPREVSTSRQAAANSLPMRAPTLASASRSISSTRWPLATRVASLTVAEGRCETAMQDSGEE